jgi:hypothetical protein
MEFREEEGEYRKLSIEDKGIPGSPLSELLIREPGLYRFYSSGTIEGLDFVLPLAPQALPVDARGPYSELIAGLLPGVHKAPGGILMADLPWRPSDRRFPRGAGLHGILTVVPDPGLEPALQPFLQPLTESFSLPCYTELPSEMDRVGAAAARVFYFDPRGARDERTPLLYLSALAKLLPQAGLPRGARFSPARSGSSSYAYTASAGVATLNLPPEEFFPLPFERGLSLPAPAPAPLPYILLLLAPYALKSWFLIRLHRRGARTRTEAPAGPRRPGIG